MSAKDAGLTTTPIFRTPHLHSHHTDVFPSSQVSKEQYWAGHQESTEKQMACTHCNL